MKIQPIANYNVSNKGNLKIPASNRLIDKGKMDDINALKLADVFEKFENDFRTTMETFIYMVKNIG